MYTEAQDTEELENWFQVEDTDTRDADEAPAKPVRAGRRTREVGDATDMYLAEIGRSQLLTAEEERELAALDAEQRHALRREAREGSHRDGVYVVDNLFRTRT